MDTMRVGLLGAGNISRSMAGTINGMKGTENYAVASRNADKARAFAEEFHVEKAYGSYEDMLADDRVDLVYIATPHSHHFQWTMAALEAGKAVLCEKAFSANAAQAAQMIETAEKKGLLLTEAIWTRYMPSRNIISSLINSGRIGEVRTVASNLGYPVFRNERMFRPELAGGCLLDLTVYPLNFTSMILGNDYTRLCASMVPSGTGVDGQDSVMLEYPGGVMASMFTTMYSRTDRRGLIYGTDGLIEVENINDPERITVYSFSSGGLKKEQEILPPPQITGYEYEVEACRKALLEGKTECPEMPHAETLTIMRIMDEIRRSFGIVFPFENSL